MKIQALTCLMPLLFFFGKASACAVKMNSIDFSTSTLVTGFTGGQHKIPLGEIGGSLTSIVEHSTVFSNCDNSNNQSPTRYYAEYNNAFGPAVPHFGKPETVVYQLPNSPGFGISFDVADPHKDWVQLANPARLLIESNYPFIGFKARVQVHIIGDIKSGKYTVPRTKVGVMRVENNKATKTPTVDLYSPAVELNVNVNSCELQVPSKVKLDNDISKPTPFEVVVTKCDGKIHVFSRFSDAKKPTATGTSLQNSGSAQGYALRLETEDGKQLQIVPTGTDAMSGEFEMGHVEGGGSIFKKFQARVVKEGAKQQPGTLEFNAIVGVAYR